MYHSSNGSISNENPPIFDKIRLNGTVSGISKDPPCKDGSARFTTVPLKPLSLQYSGRYCRKLVLIISTFFSEVEVPSTQVYLNRGGYRI